MTWEHWDHLINAKKGDLITILHFHLNGGATWQSLNGNQFVLLIEEYWPWMEELYCPGFEAPLWDLKHWITIQRTQLSDASSSHMTWPDPGAPPSIWKLRLNRIDSHYDVSFEPLIEDQVSNLVATPNFSLVMHSWMFRIVNPFGFLNPWISCFNHILDSFHIQLILESRFHWRNKGNLLLEHRRSIFKNLTWKALI